MNRKLFYYFTGGDVYHLFRDCCMIAGKKSALRSSPISRIDDFQQKWLEKHGEYLGMCFECRIRAAGQKRAVRVEEVAFEDVPEDELREIPDTSGLELEDEDGV